MDKVNCFDVLIGLIRGCQANDSLEGPDGIGRRMGGSRYLLNQAIRMVSVRDDHKCVTKSAFELWDSLKVEDSIFGYWDSRPVIYKNEIPVKVKWYKGAHGKPHEESEIFLGDQWGSFIFRHAFYIEHIIPIKRFVARLVKVDLGQDVEKVYRDIEDILDGIYVCFMRKEEDRKLPRTRRPDTLEEVLEKTYKGAGIEIVHWNR